MNHHLKTTPLNEWHRQKNANMADFGGFDMPLWYETGGKTEHLAVVKSAGLPLSHQDMGEFSFINHPWDFVLPLDKTKQRFTKHFPWQTTHLQRRKKGYRRSDF
ncbi:MAG: hypothetical protein HUK40_20320 [Desulfobacter sp.]|nr:hypothetical protein [Desulfobacter sp.]WDP86236.1 MAG: hypothetical protein HUN05_14775 [Desulfobacter sp.]